MGSWMKPTPWHDFPIVVRDRRVDEHGHPHVEIFAGIYDVFLNHQGIAVSFVPDIRATASSWPPAPPEFFENLSTANEAREAVVATGDYIVTPSEPQTGEVETLDEPDGPVTVFFVSPTEFELLSRELEDLSGKIYSITGGARISELGTYEVVALVREIVLGPHFRPSDRAQITPRTHPESVELASSFRFELGSAHTPWGLDRLRIERDGSFSYEHQVRDEVIKRRSGRLTPAAVVRLVDNLEASSFPAVREHDIPADARILAITSAGGDSAYVDVDAARGFAGYQDLVAAIERWSAFLRSEPTTTPKPYGLIVGDGGFA